VTVVPAVRVVSPLDGVVPVTLNPVSAITYTVCVPAVTRAVEAVSPVLYVNVYESGVDVVLTIAGGVTVHENVPVPPGGSVKLVASIDPAAKRNVGVPKVPDAEHVLADQPEFPKETRNWFSEYALEDGLLSLKVFVLAKAVADLYTVTLVDAVPGLAFWANTGIERGTRKRSPENSRSARMVPELNFVRYAFVGVFIIFILAGRDGLYKGDGQIVHFGRIGQKGSRDRPLSRLFGGIEAALGPMGIFLHSTFESEAKYRFFIH